MVHVIDMLDGLAGKLDQQLAALLVRQQRRIELGDTTGGIDRDELERAALECFGRCWTSSTTFGLPKARTGAENAARVRNTRKMRAELEEDLAELFAKRDPHEWPKAAARLIRRRVSARRAASA